ncbi:MAG: GntR family transcriptional regulator [Tepidisphaeraceae bacterium]|jgi:GntR family transcriptional regulator
MKKTHLPPASDRRRIAISELLFRPTERFVLDEKSPIPLYHQVEKIIEARIGQDETVGQMLPREMDLLSIFGVSRATIKRVTDNLVAKGLIERKRAIGTRIINSPMTEDLGRLQSYSEQMRKLGLNISTEMLGVEIRKPAKAVAELLHLPAGGKTLLVRRLRGTSEAFPVVLLASSIPESFGISPKEDFSASLYALIEEKYGIPIEWGEERIGARAATEEEAALLQINAGDAVLTMERLSYTLGNRPIEFVSAVYRPERYTFSIKLKR